MKIRASIETGIVHLKRAHRMDRSRLEGIEVDGLNAILNVEGIIFQWLLRRTANFLLASILSENNDLQG